MCKGAAESVVRRQERRDAHERTSPSSSWSMTCSRRLAPVVLRCSPALVLGETGVSMFKTGVVCFSLLALATFASGPPAVADVPAPEAGAGARAAMAAKPGARLAAAPK